MSSTDWEAVIGLEVHAHLKTRRRCSAAARSSTAPRENTRTCPVCLAHPGALPVAERRAIEHTIKLGLALGCEIAGARGLRAQELLLSRPAEGLPDQPVRGTAVRARRARRPDRGRRGDRRHRARASRGGRREDRARRRRDRPLRRRRLLARRLQPRRHAARSRSSASPDLRSADDGAALPAAAAADDRRARRLGRGDGEGHAARRRQRLGAQARGGRLPPALGAQEHELVHVHRTRDRGGRARADRARTSAARDRAVDLRLRPRHRPADGAPLEGGGRRLPLLPRARPRARRAAGGAGRAAARRAARAAGCAHPATEPARSASSSRTSSSRPATTGKAEALAAEGVELARRREHRDEPRRLPARERARARGRREGRT